MKSAKKSKESKKESSETEVQEFAEIFLQNLNNVHGDEPFEEYTKKVRENVFLKTKDFKKRFSKGYEVLLEEITQAKQIF